VLRQGQGLGQGQGQGQGQGRTGQRRAPPLASQALPHVPGRPPADARGGGGPYEGPRHAAVLAEKQAQRQVQRQAQGQPAPPHRAKGAGGLPSGAAPGAPLPGMAPGAVPHGVGVSALGGPPVGAPMAAGAFWQSLQGLQQRRKRSADSLAPSGEARRVQKREKVTPMDDVRLEKIDAAVGTLAFRTQLEAQGCPIASLGPPFRSGLCGECGAKMVTELNMMHHQKGKKHLAALENRAKEERGEKVEWVSKEKGGQGGSQGAAEA